MASHDALSLDALNLYGYHDDTTPFTRLLHPAIADEIRIMIPERLRVSNTWHLVYSLHQDGASLSTLYQNSRKFHDSMSGFVLVVKDHQEGVRV